MLVIINCVRFRFGIEYAIRLWKVDVVGGGGKLFILKCVHRTGCRVVCITVFLRNRIDILVRGFEMLGWLLVM